MNSLDSKFNDVKNKIGFSNDDSVDISNHSNFSFVDKSNTHDKESLFCKENETCFWI